MSNSEINIMNISNDNDEKQLLKATIIVNANYSTTLKKYMDEYHITFGDVYIGKPGIKENDGQTKMIYPIDNRLKNLTYSEDLYPDVYQKYIKHSEVSTIQSVIKEYSQIKNSSYFSSQWGHGKSEAELDECEYEKGGYFIVKGSENV